MASSLFPDPLKLWRDAVSQLENQANSLATGSLQSQETMRSLHALSGAYMGMQQMLEKAITEYLRRANLPSRKDLAELSQTLQRIESKLDLLLPAAEAKETPHRPARTRRPPASALSEAPPEPAAAAAKNAAPGKPARRPSRRAKEA